MDTASAEISPDEHAFGRQGDPGKTTRTIAIDMSDSMRFGPADITVKEGETVRFIVTNKGKMLHELVIGTMDELKAHAEMMKKFPGMEHDEPYMAHVTPGKKQELVWQFTRSGEFYFACLIPGHFEAGMLGKIKVIKG
ncbi:plastocyanin [Herbaspirillum sp. HC18]|nr:plastocyanin [Herbaspirillum sp. HC18]